MTLFDEIEQLVLSPSGENAVAFMRQKLDQVVRATGSTPALSEAVTGFMLDYATLVFASEHCTGDELRLHQKLVVAHLAKVRFLADNIAGSVH